MQNDSPITRGSLKHPELTEVQTQLKDMISYFAKIGLTVSLEEAIIQIEQPNGLETFMEELEKARGENGFVNKDKYKELESKHRFETIRRPLGNSTAFVNMFLRLLSTRTEFNEVFTQAVAESMMISKQQANMSKTLGTSDTDLL